MKRTIKDLGVIEGKKVLVRFDLNVPFDKEGKISDDTRIRAVLPTILYLNLKGAKTIIMTHLGRPKGQIVENLRLDKVAQRLQELLGLEIIKLNDIVGTEVEQQVSSLKNGDILMLENIRFHPGETKNDPELSKNLAALGDIYVNDAFGTAHRAHCSTVGVTQYIKESVAGFLTEKELDALGNILLKPEKPFVAIIGGSKVSTKIAVLESLLETVNVLVIGGAMIFTFLKAQDIEVGKSLVEPEYYDTAIRFLKRALEKKVEVILAHDVMVAQSPSEEAECKIVSVNDIPEDWMGLDVGPETLKEIAAVLECSKTVFWNGPLGMFELKSFAAGTVAVARQLADLTQKGILKTVIGGGDTVAAIDTAGVSPDQYTHVSTGGGASLEFIEGKELPGIAALQDSYSTV